MGRAPEEILDLRCPAGIADCTGEVSVTSRRVLLDHRIGLIIQSGIQTGVSRESETTKSASGGPENNCVGADPGIPLFGDGGIRRARGAHSLDGTGADKEAALAESAALSRSISDN